MSDLLGLVANVIFDTKEQPFCARISDSYRVIK